MEKIQIDENLTRKIAKLARLRLTTEEERLYTQDLQKILDYIAELGRVDTAGVEPLIHGYPLEEHFREDEPIALSEAEVHRIVNCADSPLYDQYRVPQVIGGES